MTSLAGALAVGILSCAPPAVTADQAPDFAPAVRNRQPVALAVGEHLYVANRRSGTISIIDREQHRVVGEQTVARRLSDLAMSDQRGPLLAVSEAEHKLYVLRPEHQSLTIIAGLDVPRHPVSLVASRDGRTVAVASLWSRRVTLLDSSGGSDRLQTRAVIDLPFAPRLQLLAADDTRLIVADAFGGKLAVIDVPAGRLLHVHSITGHNIRGLALSADRKELMLAHQLLNGEEATTQDNVFWGSVLLNVLRSLPLDGVLAAGDGQPLVGTTTSLGYPSSATGDPAAVLAAPAGQTIVSLGGIDQIAIRRSDVRPFEQHSVGRRPTVLAADPGGRFAWLVETFDDVVSVIDLAQLKPAVRISLGPRPPLTAAERGEQLFYDARLSLDGWYSCHSCHTDGHSNGLLSDNLGDGHFGAPKRVLSLLGTAETGPWAWNGSVAALDAQVHKSVVTTMRGDEPSGEAVADLQAYLETLSPPPGLATARGETSGATFVRGRDLFTRLGCADCHAPPTYTSPSGYEIGLDDAHGTNEFNPPSLLGVSQREKLFHDNRAEGLRDVLKRYRHGLDDAGLSEDEFESLTKFLESL